MTGVARNFFILALFHALAGMALGLFMAISQDHTAMPAHAHAVAAGWLMSAVFAFFYHLFPDAARTMLAQVHFWLTAVTSIVMIVALVFLFYGYTAIEPVVAAASVGFYAALILFVFVAVPVLRHREG